MAEQTSNSEIVAALAEEFVERYRKGERPPLEEYKTRHPHLADEIEEVFPALVMVEGLAPENDASIMGGEAPAADSSAPMVEQLGDYRILREIGRGGMGVVYEAEQVSLGRHVALKVLPQNLISDAKQAKRFEREARAAAKLHHTNIVPVFGVGEHDGMHYYVMQFIQGLGLDEVLDELRRIQEENPKSAPKTGIEIPVGPRSDVSAVDVARSLLTGGLHQTVIINGPDSGEREGDIQATTLGVKPSPVARKKASGGNTPGDTSVSRLSDTLSQSGAISLPGHSASEVVVKAKPRQLTYWQSVATMGVQVASALQYAHDQGIQHRDVKPSNLMLDLRGTVWITDFGLAKTDDQQNLTHTGDILGTLRYMPPEAFEGTSNHRGDIYSLGLTLYEMLAMQPAFDERDRNRLIKQVTQESPPRLDKANPEIPRDLVTVVHKAIERDPADRYQSAKEFAEDLQRFVEDEPIQARRISLAERAIRWSRHNRGLAASLAVVAILMTVLAVGSTIAAGYLQRLSNNLRGTVSELTQAEAELRTARNDAEHRANENAKLAQAKAELAAERQKIAAAATAAQQREAELRSLAESREKGMQSTLYAAEMNLAGQAAEEAGGVRRIRELTHHWNIDEQSTDLRGWEWYYLESLCHEDRLTLEHQYATCVDWSPDGNLLASGGKDRKVLIREPESGYLVTTLAAGDFVSDIRFSPDGSQLAVACRYKKTVQIWGVAKGELRLSLTGFSGETIAVDWSPDGKRLAATTSGEQGELIVWNLDAPENFRSIPTEARHFGVDWSSDGRHLSVGAAILDIDAAQPRANGGFSTCAAFSPDGQHIAVGISNGVELRNVETGQVVVTCVGHAHAKITAVDWSPTGRFVATSSYDDTVRVWDVQTAREVAVLRGHTGWVYDVRWSPDGTELASVGNGTIKIWRFDEQANGGNSAGIREGIRSLVWSRDGSTIAVAGSSGVQILEAESGRVLSEAERVGHWSQWGPTIAGNPRRNALAVQQGHRTLLLHERSLEQLFAWDLPTTEARSVAVSPDGTRVATCYWEQQNGADTAVVRIRNVDTSQEVSVIRLPSNLAGSLSWSPDGSRLACGGWITCAIVDPQAGTMVSQWTLDGSEWINSIAWHPTQPRVALACQDRSIQIFDVESRERRFVLLGHTGAVRSVSWSADGSRLASGGTDRTVRVWNPDNGSVLLTLRGHQEAVHAVAWSPDLVRLASASYDGDVRIWDAYAGYRSTQSPAILDAIDRRLALDPENLDDLRLRMALLEKLGRREDADRDRQHYLDILGKRHRAQPDDVEAVALLADALMSHADPVDWTPIAFEHLSSTAGAEFTVLDDDSVIVTGPNQSGDLYTVKWTSPLETITAIKLEALPDSSLPRNGPGRHPTGNFQLAALRLMQPSHSNEGESNRVPFSDVSASYAYSAYDADVRGIIDDQLPKVWHIWGQQGRPNHAVVRLAHPLTQAAGRELILELEHASQTHIVNLGRFRLLATDAPLWKDRLREQVERHAFPDQLVLSAAYLVAGDAGQAVELLSLPADEDHDEVLRLALRARAEHELGQTEAAQESCSALAECLQTSALRPKWEPVVTETLMEAGNLDYDPIRRLLGKARVHAKLLQLTREIEANPQSKSAVLNRGKLLAQLGRWNESARDFERLVRFDPSNRFPWMYAATAYLMAGDDVNYERLCRDMVAQFRGSDAVSAAATLCKMTLLRPNVVDIADLPVERLQQDIDNPPSEGYRRWYIACAALVAYRQHDPQKAIEWTQEFSDPASQVEVLGTVVRALAQQELGRTVQARQTLAQVEAAIPAELRNLVDKTDDAPLPASRDAIHHDWLIPEILRREAALLIHKTKPLPPSSSDPASGKEEDK